MDSLSQFVLGAAVGGAVLGHRAGPKALIWGGIVATLPDLDVFVPLGDPVSDFTYHRSASHSVLIQTLAAAPIAWLILRVHRGERERWKSWLLLVWLALVTHALLDLCTIYGTQIFWPLTDYPFAIGSVFIIDPLFTVPLIIAVTGALVLRRERTRLRRWAIGGLAVSTAYLAWGIGAQLHVKSLVAENLRRLDMAEAPFITMPTAFNSILWRAVVMTEGAYHEGFYSLLDAGRTMGFARHDHQPDLIAPIGDAWAVRRLLWFSKGFSRVAAVGDRIAMTDLRLGQEPFYVFSFIVGQRQNPRIVAVPNQRHSLPGPTAAAFTELWARIVHGPDYEMRLPTNEVPRATM